MRTSTNFRGTHPSDVRESVLFATEARRLGVDTICARRPATIALWGAHAEAAALVPDDPVLQTGCPGPAQAVPDHIKARRDAAATPLSVHRKGQSLPECLGVLGRALGLVRSVDGEPADAGTRLSAQLVAGADTGQNGEIARPS
jgi:hypothetical protein